MANSPDHYGYRPMDGTGQGVRGSKSPMGKRPVPKVAADDTYPVMQRHIANAKPVKQPIKHTRMGTPAADQTTGASRATGGSGGKSGGRGKDRSSGKSRSRGGY